MVLSVADGSQNPGTPSELPANSEAVPRASSQEKRNAFVHHLLTVAQGEETPTLGLTGLRQKAIAQVQTLGFPHARQEDWRFTDLSPLLDMTLSQGSTPAAGQAALLAPPLESPGPLAARLVFWQGQFCPELSQVADLPPGVVVGSLASLYPGALGDQIETRLGQGASDGDFFTALNTVGFRDGAVVWVSRNQRVTQPIQVVYLGGDRASLSQSRCLVVAEAGSQITLWEQFQGSGAGLHTTVTEIWADASAQVDHVRVQRDSADLFHLGHTAVTQGADSQYRCWPIALGGRVGRQGLTVTQTGPQTHTGLYGLSAIAGHQIADLHSRIALTHPHGTAEQRHKYILAERSHGIFNGRVEVARLAQHTNASQLNRNLLLSDRARMDTKPELDIVADNVKCTHGATVSQLAASEQFYLQSRGIDPALAQQLLIDGFALEILDTLPIPELKTDLLQAIVAAVKA